MQWNLFVLSFLIHGPSIHYIRHDNILQNIEVTHCLECLIYTTYVFFSLAYILIVWSNRHHYKNNFSPNSCHTCMCMCECIEKVQHKKAYVPVEYLYVEYKPFVMNSHWINFKTMSLKFHYMSLLCKLFACYRCQFGTFYGQPHVFIEGTNTVPTLHSKRWAVKLP